MASTLAIWLLLDAVTLEHNAEVSPLGTRRTVALTAISAPRWRAAEATLSERAPMPPSM